MGPIVPRRDIYRVNQTNLRPYPPPKKKKKKNPVNAPSNNNCVT